MVDSARPINEITGIKKRSSVLVRGDSALTIAKQVGAVPQNMDEAGFVEFLRGPRGFSDFDYWLTLPGNAGKTPTDYFNFLGLAQAIAAGLAINQLAADVIQFNADAAALAAAAAAVAAAAALDTSTLAPKASPTFTGVVDVTQQLRLSGDGTEAQIVAATNDYNPTGLANQSILRISSDAARTITGLAGGADGRITILENVGAFSITLSNADAASAAGNRFAFAANKVLGPGRTCLLFYDSVLSRWVDLSNITKASAGTIRGGVEDEAFVTPAQMNAAGNWIVAQAGEITTPAGVRTVTFQGSAGFSRQDTLTASTTYAAPTGLVDGMTYQFIFIQDGTGGRVHTLNAFFVPGSVPFAFTTAPNAYNILTGTYHAGLNKLVGCSLWNSQ